MRKGNKLLSIVLIIILIVSLNATTFASDDVEEKVIDGSILTHDSFSESITENYLRGNILLRTVARISNNGDGSVNVYGAVYGSVVCDKIILELTLQRLDGSSWTNVKSFSANVSNQNFFSKSYNVSVTKGHYYRVKVAGVAQKSGNSESQTSTTDAIWIP